MTTAEGAVPHTYRAVSPILIADDAQGLLDFLTAAFGAELRGDVFRMPDGSIGHSEVLIEGSIVMVADASDEYPALTSGVHLYVPDVDAVFAAAVAAGATVKRAPADEFYGDRSAIVHDPAGNMWSLATHVEDVSDEELSRRVRELVGEDDQAG